MKRVVTANEYTYNPGSIQTQDVDFDTFAESIIEVDVTNGLNAILKSISKDLKIGTNKLVFDLDRNKEFRRIERQLIDFLVNYIELHA